MTRERGSLEGTSLNLEAGAELSKEPVGCPEGTTIIVRDLFFNTPARMKFMKKDAAEGAGVSAAVIRCALSRPEVSVRFIRDGREEFQTAGDGDIRSCAYALLGRDFAKTMLRPKLRRGTERHGLCFASGRRPRKQGRPVFFRHGRFVKSQLLQAALEQPSGIRFFTGRYPACVCI